MKERVFKIMGSLVVLLVLFGSYGIFIFAEEEASRADLNIPPPEKFVINLAFFLGLICGIVYKATVGSFKNLYRQKFSWRKIFVPVIISILTSIPTIVFLLPHLAIPSGKFLSDFMYAFAVSYILIDVSADFSKLGEVITKKLETK